MYTIDWFTFFLILFCNGFVFSLLYFRIPKGIRRIYYVFTVIPTVIYSGIGLSYNGIDRSYLMKYLVYSSVLMIVMYLGFRKDEEKKLSENACLHQNRDTSQSVTIQLIARVGAIIFLLTYIVFLFVPSVRISQLFSPPTPSVIDVYKRIIINQTNVILDLSQLVRTMFTPLFMMFLYYEHKKHGKRVLAWIFLWIYLAFLSVEYLGRYEIVIYATFIFFVISTSYMANKMVFNAGMKQYTTIVVLFLLSVPFLLAYQYVRVGVSNETYTFLDSIKELVFFETDFPKYYRLLPNMIGQITPINYLLFFILLPIPSAIFGAKGQVILSVNKIFTTSITGLQWGAAGYSGLLPSIFGESIIIFGEDFFFIHAIIIGLIITIICKLIEKTESLSFCNLFFAISCISIARGGSQGYFGTVINSIFAYFIISFFIRAYQKRVSSIEENGGILNAKKK